MFSKLFILTSNNVVWVSFSTILFDEMQHVVKTSTAGYMPVCYEVIHLFIKIQNFLSIFLICKLKGLYLIVFFFDGFLILSLDLFNFCIKSMWCNVFQDVRLKCFTTGLFAFDDKHDPKELVEFIHLVLKIFGSRPTCSCGVGLVKFISRTDFKLI